MKPILSFIKVFSQLQNDTSLIKIDQGIQILQLKNKVLLVSLIFFECFINLYSLPKVLSFDVLACTHNCLQDLMLLPTWIWTARSVGIATGRTGGFEPPQSEAQPPFLLEPQNEVAFCPGIYDEPAWNACKIKHTSRFLFTTFHMMQYHQGNCNLEYHWGYTAAIAYTVLCSQ